MIKLVPPCAYQGGKQRLASQICDIIQEREGSDFVFYDLCCGSGAVSLEMVNRDYNVVMVDKAPFGLFYEMIGKGQFDLNIFRREIDKLPEIENIGQYLRYISNQKIDNDLLIYHYLLLQSGAFGSKQIWTQDGKWCNNTFRNYWLPTETSNRKSPVNPMMPMPETLYARVEDIILHGSEQISGLHIDIYEVLSIINKDKRNKVIYIDPPYQNTTGYLDSFNIFDIIDKLKGQHIYVSEGFEFELPNCESIVLSEGRKKGNVSGTVKKNAVKEVLNIIY